MAGWSVENNDVQLKNEHNTSITVTASNSQLDLDTVSPPQSDSSVPQDFIDANNNHLHYVAWLQEILPAKDELIMEPLKGYFSACDTNPTQSILSRLDSLVQKLSVLDQTRQDQIRRFYLRLLETLLVQEEQRLQQNNFTVLLHHELFHRSLIACCVEIISFCEQEKSIGFPNLLMICEIPAFELSKVIENVIRYEKTLPETVRDHLKQIEESLLESYVWQEQSPVYGLLQRGGKEQQTRILAQLMETCDRVQPRQQQSRPNNNVTLNNNQLTQITPLMSPRAPMRTVTSAERSQLYSPARGTIPFSISLEMLYKKVFALCYRRLYKLVFDLKAQASFEQIIKALMNVIVWHYPLLINRHIDQIIICTLYGVCRAQKQDITYRSILQMYRLQTQSTSKIWREVLLNKENDKQETGDIIQFYNSVFISLLENYLLDFQRAPTKIPITADANSPLPIKLTNRDSSLNLTVSASPSRPAARNQTPNSTTFEIGRTPPKNLNINTRVNTPTRRKISRKLFDTNNNNTDVDPAAHEAEMIIEDQHPSKKQKTSHDTLDPLATVITQLSNNPDSAHPAILKSSK